MRKPGTIIFAALLIAMTGVLSAQSLNGPLVVNDRWPECTSLQTWLGDVLKIDGVENGSEAEQAIAAYHWLRLFCRVSVGGMQHAHEGQPADEKYVLDAHKNLFVYGWGFCDTQSRIMEAAWSEYKHDKNAVNRVCVLIHAPGGYHTYYRIRQNNGSYGGFDPRFGFYLLEKDRPDARILDWDEIGVDKNIEKNRKFTNRCGPFFEYPSTELEHTMKLQPGVLFSSEKEWLDAGKETYQSFVDPKYEMGTPYHDMNWNLPRGTKLVRYWNNDGAPYYRALKRMAMDEYPDLPSGRFFRVTTDMFDGSWPKTDPNFKYSENYLETIPADEGYPEDMEGGKSIGQAWGKLAWNAPLETDAYLDAVKSSTRMSHNGKTPYLTPEYAGVVAETIFDFYVPYVIVEGTFSGKLVAGNPDDKMSVELRAQFPKTNDLNDPEEWTLWRNLTDKPGEFRVTVGSESYDPHQVTVDGKYHFQLRVRAYANGDPAKTGLESLGAELSFENGIMSIPRLLPGRNELKFKLDDRSAVKSPVKITYNFQTENGPESENWIISQGDAAGAKYVIDVPDLVRCDSLIIQY